VGQPAEGGNSAWPRFSLGTSTRASMHSAKRSRSRRAMAIRRRLCAGWPSSVWGIRNSSGVLGGHPRADACLGLPLSGSTRQSG